MHGVSVLAFVTAVVACVLGAPQTFHNGRVIGGENALPGEFPWMVSLRQGGGHFCGGSIISAYIILTAAHCVIGSNPLLITVVTGTNKLDTGGNSHGVDSIVVHASYNPDDSWRNDIAILKLRNPITMSSIEYPTVLPQPFAETAGDTMARISGWGYTRYPGVSLPNDLQKLDLAVVTNEVCDAGHETYNIYPTQLCAGTVSGEGVCGGDSGSPLVANGTQVGIVSWGKSCATGVADVYTRVASFVDWIMDNSVLP